MFPSRPPLCTFGPSHKSWAVPNCSSQHFIKHPMTLAVTCQPARCCREPLPLITQVVCQPQPMELVIPWGSPSFSGLPCPDQAIRIPLLAGVIAYGDDHITQVKCEYPYFHYAFLRLPTINSRELQAATRGFNCRLCCQWCPLCLKTVEIFLSCWDVLTHQADSRYFHLSVNKLAFITFNCAWAELKFLNPCVCLFKLSMIWVQTDLDKLQFFLFFIFYVTRSLKGS